MRREILIGCALALGGLGSGCSNATDAAGSSESASTDLTTGAADLSSSGEEVPCEAAYASQRNRPAVRVGTEGFYPPYNFLNDDGELVGWEMDFLAKMMDSSRLGRAYMLESREWDGCCDQGDDGSYVAPTGDGLFAATIRGDYAFTIAGISSNGIRNQVLRFSDSYGDSQHHHQILYRTDAGIDAAHGRVVLDGRTVAAQQGTTHYLYLIDRYGDVANVVTTATQDEAALMLLRGEADAMLGSSDSGLIAQWFAGDAAIVVSETESYDRGVVEAGGELASVDREGHDNAYGPGSAILLPAEPDRMLERAINCAIAELAAPQPDG